ncbi:uncharacterized protein L199_006926 [Kwoniella botswanensis]|uniref:uncharacterized protein n=1 Tax=Kwoniella botswanensis TaxID=1268659 RepID=UPI00315CBA78
MATTKESQTQAQVAIGSCALPSDPDAMEVLPALPEPRDKWDKIHRSSLFQICVVSALAFCGSAMADAISGLGGGGQASPYTVSAAQAASYSATALIALFGGPLASRMGLRLMLIIAASTFAINGSAYLCLCSHNRSVLISVSLSNVKAKWVPLGLNFALCVLCILPTLLIVCQVPEYRQDAKNKPSEITFNGKDDEEQGMDDISKKV